MADELTDASAARHQRAAAQAGMLFVAAGLISLCYDVLPNDLGDRRNLAICVDAATTVAGVVLRALPWARWHARWLSAVPLFALVYVAVQRALGVIPDETYGIWIILVFVWIGLWQPPGFAIRTVPIAVATYLAPFAIVGVPEGGTLASVAISVPVAALIGETLSRRDAAVQRADAERQVALDALARANLTDDLTGIGNRRYANALLDALGPGDVLVILDLDHFKRVNDVQGHQCGDRLLAQLGEFLREHVRSDDSVARYGGEEFIMVLRGAEGHAGDIVERLLADWRATLPPTTLSAGVARHLGDSWSTTFADADAALYRAKQTGRDRAVVATA